MARVDTPVRMSGARFYALDVEGIDPGEVEDLLARKCEALAKPVLVELAASQGVPTAEGLGMLISFCGMQLAASSRSEKRAAKIEADVARQFASLDRLNRETPNTLAVRIMLNVFKARWMAACACRRR